MGIGSVLGEKFRKTPAGPRNKITDVAGVLVGHKTLLADGVRTGVTAVLPHPGDLFHEKVPAAAHVINGFGKSTGLVQIRELGTIETPVLMTNTLSVGAASDGLVRYMLRENADIGRTTGSVNPVVTECFDGDLNDIRQLAVTAQDVDDAIAAAGPDFEEGAVGAGAGMSCYGLKGGIGSASRVVPLGNGSCTVGALLLTNFGVTRDLVLAGDPVGARIAPLLDPDPPTEPERGSCIILLATDAPLSDRQLGRLARRAQSGLARSGGYVGHGSGEIVLAFSTAYRVPHGSTWVPLPTSQLADDDLDPLFYAVIDAVEESVISSMLHAETAVGWSGKIRRSLREFL